MSADFPTWSAALACGNMCCRLYALAFALLGANGGGPIRLCVFVGHRRPLSVLGIVLLAAGAFGRARVDSARWVLCFASGSIVFLETRDFVCWWILGGGAARRCRRSRRGADWVNNAGANRMCVFGRGAPECMHWRPIVCRARLSMVHLLWRVLLVLVQLVMWIVSAALLHTSGSPARFVRA